MRSNKCSIYQTLIYSSCLSQDNFEFSYHNEDQIFYNISEISNIPNTNFNDMSSPYGYSGYYTNSSDLLFIEQAIKHQEKKHRRKISSLNLSGLIPIKTIKSLKIFWIFMYLREKWWRLIPTTK